MDDAKQQLIDRLQSANNILVTVSRDPSVDQLASCIGLTLLLNKQGKHAAAVFSGKVPSTLEFLKPDETLEKNTDSLRDFIISLDKAKADKLRYKVEEDVVRIFITPYKTSLSADDLEFSEGDFNVDVVVALGVQKQEDFDQAITTHGRILHDATLTSINTTAEGGLGSINWNDAQASSLSELVTDLADAWDNDLIDTQIATALLTGIVSETGRFSNDRTSSQTMSASALLLSAGANQQLVASQLEGKSGSESSRDMDGEGGEEDAGPDGVLDIDHSAADPDSQPEEAGSQGPQEQPGPGFADPPQPPELSEPAAQPDAAPDAGDQAAQQPAPEPSGLRPGPKLVTEPPQLGGTLTANSQSERLDPVTDPLSLPQSEPPAMFGPTGSTGPEPLAPPATDADGTSAPASQPPAGLPDDNATLTEIEKSVDSPHLTTSIDSVRNEVDQALAGSDVNEPIEALNAQPMGGELHEPQTAPASDQPQPITDQPGPDQQITDQPQPVSDQSASDQPVPDQPAADQTAADQPSVQESGQQADTPDNNDPNAPPPVPPPIPFQFGNSSPPKP